MARECERCNDHFPAEYLVASDAGIGAERIVTRIIVCASCARFALDLPHHDVFLLVAQK